MIIAIIVMTIMVFEIAAFEAEIMAENYVSKKREKSGSSEICDLQKSVMILY